MFIPFINFMVLQHFRIATLYIAATQWWQCSLVASHMCMNQNQNVSSTCLTQGRILRQFFLPYNYLVYLHNDFRINNILSFLFVRRLKYVTFNWSFENHLKIFFHFFSAICSPRCKQGGRCLKPGLCTCTSGFTPPLCKRKTFTSYSHVIMVAKMLAMKFWFSY